MQTIFPAARETDGTTPRRLNSTTASRAQRNWPVRLTPMTASQSPKVISWNRRVALDPRVVDENIDGTELVDHVPEHPSYLVLARDVGAVRKAPRPRTADFLDRGFRLLFAGNVIHHHIGAGSSERDRGGAADSGVSARHQRFLSRQKCASHCRGGRNRHDAATCIAAASSSPRAS